MRNLKRTSLSTCIVLCMNSWSELHASWAVRSSSPEAYKNGLLRWYVKSTTQTAFGLPRSRDLMWKTITVKVSWSLSFDSLADNCDVSDKKHSPSFDTLGHYNRTFSLGIFLNNLRYVINCGLLFKIYMHDFISCKYMVSKYVDIFYDKKVLILIGFKWCHNEEFCNFFRQGFYGHWKR